MKIYKHATLLCMENEDSVMVATNHSVIEKKNTDLQTGLQWCVQQWLDDYNLKN